jgi:hypothetical protein
MPEVKALTSNLKRRSGSSNAELVARELQVLNPKPCTKPLNDKRAYKHTYLYKYAYVNG